jgi:N-acetylglucosamine malate deacetylase 1
MNIASFVINEPKEISYTHESIIKFKDSWEERMQSIPSMESSKRNVPEYLRNLHSYHGARDAPVEDPEVSSNSRVIVLSPHHDDAIIGCGGTISKMAKRGARIKVLFMTDTSYGSTIGPAGPLVRTRQKDTEETMARLNCFELGHLGMTSLSMRNDSASVRRLHRAIDYHTPELVFMPSLDDPHPDNHMTGMLAAHALKEYGSRLTLYSYDVWGGLFPNTMVEITQVMKDKMAAINLRCHQARMKEGGVRLRELNSLRLFATREERYCEPFLRQEREDFVTLAGRLGVYGP